MQISIAHGAETPEPIVMKLGRVDYVGPHPLQLSWGIARWMLWANM